MLESKISSNNLIDGNYDFIDSSDRANNTFHVYDLPETFYLGKNQFKILADKDKLVDGSQIYIDILDARGNPIFYKVSNLISPDRTRTIIVHIYDSTPIGECLILIAGRLGKNPLTGELIPYSNSPSQYNFKDNPNVLWRTKVNVSLTENVTDIIFDKLPTVTYSEKRIPVLTDSNLSRFVELYPTASGKISMQSTFDNYEVNNGSTDRVREGLIIDNFPEVSSGSVRIEPYGILPLNTDYSIIRSTGFNFSASMEGGKVEVNRIQYEIPFDSVNPSEFSNVSYSGSIVEVINPSTVKVYPPFNRTIEYNSTSGRKNYLTISKFLNHSNFTCSFANPSVFVSSSTEYKSYLKLEIENAEPEYGSVKGLQIAYKEIGTFGQLSDLGMYPVETNNILTVPDQYQYSFKRGIQNVDMGTFPKPSDSTLYWSGSSNFGSDLYLDLRQSYLIKNGISVLLDSNVSDPNQYYKIQLINNIPNVKKDTEYVFEFDLGFQTDNSPIIQPQVDIFISGSSIFETTQIDSRMTLTKIPDDYRYGTFLGSINSKNGNNQRGRFYFKSTKSGNIVPFFIIRSIGIDLGNISIKPRNELGYSTNYIETYVNLSDVNASNELMIEVKYLNSKNYPSDYSSKLYGVEFEGNTVNSITLPSGLISSSQQIIERLPAGTVSSSQQIVNNLPNGLISSSQQLPSGIISSSNQIINSLPSGILSSSIQIQNYNIFPTTGSNIFLGNQKITGSVEISSSVDVPFRLNDNRIVVSSSYVGINVLNPSSSLHVSASNKGVSRIQLGGSSNRNLFIADNTGGEFVINHSSSGPHIRFSASNRTFFEQTCGWGGTPPGMTQSDKICVQTRFATSESTGILVSNSLNEIILRVQGNKRIAVNHSGPSASLHISGSTNDPVFMLETPTNKNLLIVCGSNLYLNSSASSGNGNGIIAIGNAQTLPTTLYNSVSYIYADSGTLKVKSANVKNVDLSGSFSGSFAGNGSNLTNIQSASYASNAGNNGSYTGTPDGSGLLFVRHSLGRIPTTFIAIVSGSSPYFPVVNQKDIDSVAVKIYRLDTAAPITGTSVTLDWIAR